MNKNMNNTTTNATLNTILNASITCKRKNQEGKYEQFTTTMLKDGFKHVPKASELPDDCKAVFTALDKTFEYMERMATASNDNQRNKCAHKAEEYARQYLSAVGISDGIGNVLTMLGVFAPKKQTTKGEVKGGYTTKSTFIKSVLFLTYQYTTKGAWCALKTSASKSAKTVAHAFDEEGYKQILMSFGMEETAVLACLAQLKKSA